MSITALPVSYKSSFITNRPWISEDFLKKRTLPDSPNTTAVSKVPRLAGDNSISTPMSQEGKDVGNDRSECNNANPTQPQQSTSKVSSTTLSEDTEATQVSGSKYYGEKTEVPATLAKEILIDKLQLCDQWDVVSILFPYLQGG